MQLDATGRADESLAVEFVGPLNPNGEEKSQNGKLLSFSLQKGQLKANIYFQPFHSANLEVIELIYCLCLYIIKERGAGTNARSKLLPCLCLAVAGAPFTT